jgi:eukaryotic-like serine/threonine-protein kinase
MLFRPGSRVSAYEIDSFLGAGGMGEVYRAHDTRLGRTVALKVLLPGKAAADVMRWRLLREAKAVSALNHPNIVQLHDVIEDGTVVCLVMEHISGKPLDQCIPRGGMGTRQAVKYALDIAAGPAAAHSAGVVHRDLKPGNVLVTPEGAAKLVDFGLAKLNQVAPGDDQTTIIAPPGGAFTQLGTIVGTVAYMSPEQAEGKPIDARSDIFSFGSLLYEMLTGQRAFSGDSTISTLSSIVRDEPRPIAEISSGVPRDVQRIVERCLRKDPNRRWQTAIDVRNALDDWSVEAGSTHLHSRASISEVTTRAGGWILGTVGLLVLIGLGLWAYARLDSRAAPAQATLPVPLTAYEGNEISPTFSPDGSQIAFSWNGEKKDNYDIYVKPTVGGEPLRLTQHADADWYPAWSPDGQWIAFVRAGSGPKYSLMLMPSLGGAERRIVDIGAGDGVAWTPDGHYIAAADRDNRDRPQAIYLIAVESGERIPLTNPPESIPGDYYPAISADGTMLSFVRYKESNLQELHVLPLSGGYKPDRQSRIVASGFGIYGAAFLPGREEIVYTAAAVGGPRLWRARLERPGAATLVQGAEDVQSVAVSRTNRLAYTRTVRDSDIYRLPVAEGERTRAAVALVTSTYVDRAASYSPDGKRIVFASRRTGAYEIWSCEADGSRAAQLTFYKSYSGSPKWSSNGQHIAFDSTVSGRAEIYVMRADGGDKRQITHGRVPSVMPVWSVDGESLFFRSTESGREEIWRIPAAGGTAAQMTRNGGSYALPSPDGKYVYYTKERAGNGLWRMRLDSDTEEPVIDRVFFRSVALGARGVWFLKPLGSGGGDVMFLRYGNTAPERIRTLEKLPDVGLSVSPDERFLLVSHIVAEGADLMLIENFR